MPSFRTATVTALLEEREGLQRVDTELGRAYVLTALTGPVAVGDDVVLNTTAVDLGLGTGGWHVVHWNLSRREWEKPGAGHIMKLRYTSLQIDTGAAEETDSAATDLDGMPVVACTLHSQVGVVSAIVRHLAPRARIAYVMTDGAALPLAISDLVVALRATGIIDLTVTAGHAFGGDLEAVSVPSALTVARGAGAHVAIVGMGPGVVGTGSELGTTAVEAAQVLDIAGALGGRPILCVRASSGDGRDRHQGVSHHTETVLRLTHAAIEVPVPAALDVALSGATVVDIPAVGEVLGAIGLEITTMGRGVRDDRLFFDAAAAAGVAAAVHLGR